MRSGGPVIVEKLNAEVNAALAEPIIKARFVQFGGAVFPQSSTGFAKFIVQETNKWAKVIQFAGIKAD